jgi:uncharacterized membrane protein YbhN (UPF0104 family)
VAVADVERGRLAAEPGPTLVDVDRVPCLRQPMPGDEPRDAGAEALATTLAIWAVEAGVWLCCADAAGLHVSALEALYLLALASLFVFVPAGPGNVGTLDAAVLFGAHAIGGRSSTALSFLILLRLVLIVPISAVGLGFLVARYR